MRRPLTCTAFRREYSAFRDGELPTERAALVEAHLADCDPCRRRHHALEFGLRLLRSNAPYPDALLRPSDDRMT